MRWRRVLSVGVVFAALTLVLVAGVADAATSPGVPTGLGVVGGEGQLVLSWTAPTSNGGSAITGYRIDLVSNAMVGVISRMVQTSDTLTSYTLTGLTNGGSYSVTVAAVNAEGTGTATTAVLGTPYTLSGPPGDLDGVLVDGILVLSWSAPGVTGGAVVTGYRIEQRITGGDMWSVVIDNTGLGFTTYNVLGLTGGTTYDFQVSAINAAGMGPLSTSWSTSIPTIPPTTSTSTIPPTTSTSTIPPTTSTSTVSPTTSTSTVSPTISTSLAPPTPCTTAPPPTLAVDPTPDPRIPPTPLYVC